MTRQVPRVECLTVPTSGCLFSKPTEGGKEVPISNWANRPRRMERQTIGPAISSPN